MLGRRKPKASQKCELNKKNMESITFFSSVNVKKGIKDFKFGKMLMFMKIKFVKHSSWVMKKGRIKFCIKVWNGNLFRFEKKVTLE